MDRSDALLRKYPKIIVLLRKQYKETRLRFVFGAGVSKPIDFPTWSGLVDRIAGRAKAKNVIGGKVELASLTAKVQYLYEHFMRQEIARGKFDDDRFKREEARARWNDILRECLYDKAKNVEAHPYLKWLAPLVRNSKFAITYNFDDTLEKSIGAIVPPADRSGKRLFETVWSLSGQLREDVLTIYHPNGFIPSKKNDYASNRIVFSDESFSDQIASDQPGTHSFIHHFLQNTCILFGLSLEDVSLKQHLRKLALIAPGLNHVIVSHYEETEPYSKNQQEAISAANFEVYNLLTMFLTNEDIGPLCKLITEDPPEFCERAARLGVAVKYTYYVTGGVAAGKTTGVSNFGNCNLYDEWVEPSPAIISQPFNKLSAREKADADRWIGRQFHLKNRALRNCGEGIHILDRAPLDPLSFEKGSTSARAKKLIASFRPDHATHRVEDGQVILLECPDGELRRRLISKNKFWTEQVIQRNVTALKNLYGGCISVDSYVGGPHVTAKDMSRLIFMQGYKPLDLDCELVRHAAG
jgi:hypothetical protein